MKLEVIEPPEREPVSVAEANEYLRIDDDIEDSLVESFIKAARMFCENYQHQVYYTQKLRLILSATECSSCVELPRSQHLQSIERVMYQLPTGENKSLCYVQKTGDVLAEIRIVEPLPIDAEIMIEYVAGEDEPEIDDVKTAIKILISGMHNNRTPYAEANKPLQEVPFSVKALLNRGRLIL